jgi:Flp pilus assembly pilin Flp
MKIVHGFLTAAIALVVIGLVSTLCTSCSVTMGADGSKSATVDASLIPVALKVLAEK